MRMLLEDGSLQNKIQRTKNMQGNNLDILTENKRNGRRDQCEVPSPSY